MSKILVTGATGFVGNHLIPALISEGHEVRCAVSRRVQWLKVEQVLVNKLEQDPDWTEALLGIDVVIHLAAKSACDERKSRTFSGITIVKSIVLRQTLWHNKLPSTRLSALFF